MTPAEMEKLPKELERTMTALEMSVMAEVVDRIRETAEITPLIDWKLNRLSMLGVSRGRIKELLETALETTDLQVEDIYQKAIDSDYIRHKALYDAVGKEYLPYNENPWLKQVVEGVKQQTKDSLRPFENITQTTGFNIHMGKSTTFTPLSEYLERSLDKVMMGIAAGTHTYDQAIVEVINEMTNSGLRMVTYPSKKEGEVNRSERIEVVARRAVMTGVAQMVDKVNEHNGKELDTDFWEVDWHMGARPSHMPWQGKVWSSEQMVSVCGLGDILGFAGINCYHIRFPFIPGISKRQYTDEWLEEQNRRESEKKDFRGRGYTVYEALQYQRRLERTIRKLREDIQLLEKAKADRDAIIAAKARRQLVNKRYIDFSRDMGLPQQRERLTIPAA